MTITLIPPSAQQSTLRILIVDDNPQVRQDLRLLLQLSEQIEVVGEASDGQQAIRQVQLLKPEVVIMDLEMPILDGLQATQQIKLLKIPVRVVILSVHSTPRDIERAMSAGADAFVQKGSSYATLMESIIPTNPKGEEK